ncbi:hypothetical protein F0P94_13710 [Adhaeribacter soli]|uniref:Uncharacterized protein n=1 Tax=Adhaeribacter soli TaxID=2607655 RepID=A0A5N1IV82_9BACT|nr:hypothetical protein F0P94_13710 [Adhaeribacter soli]
MPKVYLILALLLFPFAVRAVSPDSTAVYELKSKRIGINTFSMYSFLAGADSLNAKQVLRYYLFQDHLYNSVLPENRFTREDYFANLEHSWRFRPKWMLQERFLYQNNRASQASVSSLTGQLHFTPNPLFDWQTSYSVFAGVKRDARSLFADTGPEYGGTLTVSQYQPELLKSAGGSIFFSQASLAPRQFQRLLADARYEKQFGAYGSTSLRAEYRRNRTEDYLSGNVQRIQSDTLAIYGNGTYVATEQLSFRSSNYLALPARAFSYRGITENASRPTDSRYEQFELVTLQEAIFKLPKLQAGAQLGYKERNRRYNNDRDKPKDLLQNTTSWGLNLTYLFTEKHSISSQAQGELLRVNTPSNQNNEDRDEALYQGRIVFTSRWLPGFRTNIGLVGTYKQYVFIKAVQTAENYTERSLHYEPGFIWAPGRFSWEAQMQVQANYQVRDLSTEQLKNRANRTFNQTHQLRYDLTRNLALQLEYYRRENRLGLLNWDNFSESPLDTTISNSLAFFVRKGITGRKMQTSLRAGYRYFEQRIQGKAGFSDQGQTPTQIYLHNITRQHGPELSYECHTHKGLRIYTSFWLQRLHTFKAYRQTDLPYLGTTYSPEELQQQTKAWYPYFDVSVHWALRFSGYRSRRI